MEEKDKSKQGEELLEVDEKGKAIEKKVEEKKPKKIPKHSLMYSPLSSFLFYLVFSSKFLFLIKTSKRTIFIIN